MDLQINESAGTELYHLVSLDDERSTRSLPGELLLEILSWLPIKSLLRFRCVSKSSLRLLTTDPHFAKLHLDHSLVTNTNPGILAVETNNTGAMNKFHFALDFTACDNSVHFEVPFCPDTKSYGVKSICNGMILLSVYTVKDNVYLWNPLTRDYIAIPVPPTPKSLPSRLRKSTFGFGFHQATDQYKLIRFASELDFVNYVFLTSVSVYTLGRDSSWRTLEQDNHHYDTCLHRSTPPHVNGALHWLSRKTGLPPSSAIVSFNLEQEILQEMPVPKDVSSSERIDLLIVAELGGLLCLFCNQFQVDVQIWVMKQYGVVGSWSKQFTIGRPEVCGLFVLLHPLGVSNGHEIILMKRFSELILYNQVTNSIRDLKTFGSRFIDAYTYTGSLVSPTVISGLRRTMN